MCMLVVVVVIIARGPFDARVCHLLDAFSLARGVLRSVSVLRFGTRAAVIVALSFGVVSCLPLVFLLQSRAWTRSDWLAMSPV